jgi:hypothetical protein
MARSTNAPCKGRIQMRKTNPLHLFTFGLQRTAGPYSWVICVGLAAHRRLPLYPQEQTSSPPVGMSQCAHKAPFLRGSNERGRKSSLKRLRNFLRISLRSPAYSSTIRRASCVREGLLGGSGPESVRHLRCGDRPAVAIGGFRADNPRQGAGKMISPARTIR